jgi:hypothetical protein
MGRKSKQSPCFRQRAEISYPGGNIQRRVAPLLRVSSNKGGVMIQTMIKNTKLACFAIVLLMFAARFSLAHVTNVTSVSINPPPAELKGKCPPRISVAIGADGSGNIKYQVEYNPPAGGVAAGPQRDLEVINGTADYEIDLYEVTSDYEGAVTVRIVAPNNLVSQAVKIKVTCAPLGHSGETGGQSGGPDELRRLAERTLGIVNVAVIAVAILAIVLAFASLGLMLFAFSLLRFGKREIESWRREIRSGRNE